MLTGEQVHGALGYKDLLREKLMDIAASDVTLCGDIGVMRSIAKQCDNYAVTVPPHNISSPVGTVAGVHLSTAIPNFMAMEYHPRKISWWDRMVDHTAGRGPVLEDEYVDVPEGLGLGIELDRDIVEPRLVDDSELPL